MEKRKRRGWKNNDRKGKREESMEVKGRELTGREIEWRKKGREG